MKRNILFIQLEIFLDCAPHMGMCLFINNLRRQGMECTAYLVNCNHMEELFPVIATGKYDLICLDSSFTTDMVNELSIRFPHIPILAGGVNALALFLHTNIAFAVFGPGREAAGAFVKQLFGEKNFSEVPNLFYKEEKTIHYSNRTIKWDLPSELLPYDPYLDWRYLGPSRKFNANTEAVSIVAGTGCLHSKTVRATHRYDIDQAVGALGYGMTDTARIRLDEIFNQKTHGCSFCIFQIQEYTVYPVDRTVELLLQQARYLSQRFSTKAFCIQTENPFPFLNPFLKRILEEKISIDFVSIRTRPDTLLKQRAKLEKALDTAREEDFHFSIEEIGFETFTENELALFHKGVNVETNMEALEYLRSLKQRYGQTVSVHVGHGIILFHPWTTLESMTSTLEVMARYPDVFPRFYPNRLTLYCEFLPLFQKISTNGLAMKTEAGYGWDFTSVAPLAEKAFELYTHLYSAFGPDISIPKYIAAIQRLDNHSMEQILNEEFDLIPVGA